MSTREEKAGRRGEGGKGRRGEKGQGRGKREGGKEHAGVRYAISVVVVRLRHCKKSTIGYSALILSHHYALHPATGLH